MKLTSKCNKQPLIAVISDTLGFFQMYLVKSCPHCMDYSLNFALHGEMVSHYKTSSCQDTKQIKVPQPPSSPSPHPTISCN